MNHSRDVFSTLAAKVERGDLNARTQLHRQLAPEMVHIVRRVIQEGRGRTMLDRRILSEAKMLGLNAELESPEDREDLIRLVAERLCTSVVSRLHTDEDHLSDETVCNTRLGRVG